MAVDKLYAEEPLTYSEGGSLFIFPLRGKRSTFAQRTKLKPKKERKAETPDADRK